MLTPKLFTEDLFDDWFGLDREMEDLNCKIYGKRAQREMLTDIREHEDHYELEIDLPGFHKEDIQVELENGYLTVTATKGHEQEEKNKEGKMVRQERYSGTMSRSFYVGEELKSEEIHGKYEGGVLTLNIPKKTQKLEKKDTILIEG
ncbi:MAG: Hsp20/alpha crystallin family protein [Erysipelotrichaceae bacterium]|nr:Hsp20/alpha crystallin family protein [Erysipelotrichaceae bacterium]